MSGRTTVMTQAELDVALADHVEVICIDSPAGVWLRISDTGSSRVVAWGSSSVVARESSSVEAWESSRVEARESSRVVAWGSSSVVARESSRVVAWGSSSVVARESSSVVASKYTAVYLWSQRVTLDSVGAVIDCTSIDLTDREQWMDYHGARPTAGGKLTVFKAVDDELVAGHSYTPTTYPVGEEVTAADWRDTPSCGRGLHFGLTPASAQAYFRSASRFLACEIDVETMVVLDDKVKAPACRVLHEVDIHGDALTPAGANA